MMFETCADPATLAGLELARLLPHHRQAHGVLRLLRRGAAAARGRRALSRCCSALPAPPRPAVAVLAVSLLGKTYSSIVRGVPDIAFFLFFVIALDQCFEFAPPQGAMPRLGRAGAPGQRFRRLRRGQAAAVARRRNGCTKPTASSSPCSPSPSSTAPSPPRCSTARCARCRAPRWRPPKPTA